MTNRRGVVSAIHVAAALLLAFALALAGCGREGPQFRASDVTGSSFGRELALTVDIDPVPQLACTHTGGLGLEPGRLERG